MVCRPRHNGCRSRLFALGWAARYHSSGQARAADGHVVRAWRAETLIAMPALRLDAAFAWNLGDSHGNAAYTGIESPL